MFSAVFPRTAPQRRSSFFSFIAAAVLLIAGAHAASAQQAPQETGIAKDWTPKGEKFSLHLHGGLFTPIDHNAPSPTVGLRLSKLVGSHLQAGVLTGWTFERKDLTDD